MSPLDLAIVVAGLVIAGSAKGLAGMGLPLIATPVLGAAPSARRIRVAGPFIGLIGGALQSSTSIASPVVGGYFHTRRLASADFVAVLAALFQLNSLVQIGGFLAYDLLTADLLALGLLGIVPTLLGLIAGIELRGRISATRFRQLIVVMLVLSVVNLLWRTSLA